MALAVAMRTADGPGDRGNLTDADGMETMRRHRGFQNYIADDREFGTGPPFVVDHIRIKNVSGGFVNYGFFEEGTVDPRGSQASVELSRVRPGGSMILPASVALTTRRKVILPVCISAATSTKLIMQLANE